MSDDTPRSDGERPDRWIAPEAPDGRSSAASDADGAADLRDAAARVLASRIRPPSGLMTARWSRADDTTSDLVDVNELLPLVLAWRGGDPELAQELVLAALAAQDPSGAIYRRFQTDGFVTERHAPWPLVARAALKAWEARRNPRFLGQVMGPLEAYVDWVIGHFDAARTGFPAWPSAEGAPVPELWGAQAGCVDLAAFLISELDALLALGPADPRGGFPTVRYASLRRRLRAALDEFFWSERHGGYRDRAAGGDHFARVTLGAFAPLLLADLDPERRTRLTTQLLEGQLLRRNPAVALWQSWPEDTIAPRCTVLGQVLVLEMLAAGGDDGGAVAAFRKELAGPLDRQWSVSGGFSSDLSSAGRGEAPAAAPPPAAAEPAESSAVAAALACVVFDARCHAAVAASPGAAAPAAAVASRWSERHRMAIVAVVILAILAGVLSLAAFMLSRKGLPGGSGEALVNFARECYRSGNHDEAIRLYEEFLDRTGPGNGNVEVLLGNALFRKGRYAEAEKHYREGLKTEESSLHALYNLGQALARQKRYPEAAECFKAFVETYRNDYPDLAAQSQMALEIVLLRIALQSPPVSAPGTGG